MNMRQSINTARVNGPVSRTDGVSVIEFRFGDGDPVFAGHFPGHPLLPGVFQLEMVRAGVEWVLDCALEVRDVSRAKFLRPIVPEETVRLELKLVTERTLIRARAWFSVGGKAAGETTMRLWRSAR